MRKTIILASILVIIVIVIIVLLRTKCATTSGDPVIPNEISESSDNLPETIVEDDFPPDTSPGLTDPLDFAKEYLTINPNISETELRVALYKAGYSPIEIRGVIGDLFPKEESSKPEESSESSSESSKVHAN